MLKTRTEKARFNMITSILNQLISSVCGFFIPRIMIGHFRSEIYGATTSITQFLSYISLLEGGIGAVAKAALYKPLADNDVDGVSSVYLAIKKFFIRRQIMWAYESVFYQIYPPIYLKQKLQLPQNSHLIYLIYSIIFLLNSL